MTFLQFVNDFTKRPCPSSCGRISALFIPKAGRPPGRLNSVPNTLMIKVCSAAGRYCLTPYGRHQALAAGQCVKSFKQVYYSIKYPGTQAVICTGSGPGHHQLHFQTGFLRLTAGLLLKIPLFIPGKVCYTDKVHMNPPQGAGQSENLYAQG